MSNSTQTSAGSRINALLDENSFVEVGGYKMCIRDRGIVVIAMGRMDGDPGRLVDHKYILILIYNGEGKVNRDNGLGRGLFRKHYF